MCRKNEEKIKKPVPAETGRGEGLRGVVKGDENHRLMEEERKLREKKWRAGAMIRSCYSGFLAFKGIQILGGCRRGVSAVERRIRAKKNLTGRGGKDKKGLVLPERHGVKKGRASHEPLLVGGKDLKPR